MDLKVSFIGMHSRGVDYLVALTFQSEVKNHATQSICIDIQHLTIIYTYNIKYTFSRCPLELQVSITCHKLVQVHLPSRKVPNVVGFLQASKLVYVPRYVSQLTSKDMMLLAIYPPFHTPNLDYVQLPNHTVGVQCHEARMFGFQSTSQDLMVVVMMTLRTKHQ